jgi:lipopolysaccharide exporter
MARPDAAQTAGRDVLKDATLSGLRWASLARIVSEIVAFGSMVVLAHLIAPAEFGYVAIALIVQALGLVLVGDGVGNALVQRRVVEREHLESAALIGLCVGFGCSIGAFLLAPLLGGVTGGKSAELVRMLSPVFLINSIAVVPSAVLQRRLDFRRISLVEVGGLLARSLAAVGLALAGLNAEAIVVGVLFGAVITTALYLAWGPSAAPRWRGEATREIARFGLPAALAGVMLHGFRNVDYAIIGAKLGATQLGFYWRSYQLGVEYQRKVTGIVSRLAFPVFSRASDLDDMRAIRARIMRLQSTIVLPPLALLIALAPQLVPWMLGSVWAPVVLPTQLLAGVGMMIAVQSGIGPLLLAAGRPRTVLAYNSGSVVVYCAVVFVAAGQGLTAVCLAALGFHAAQLLAVQRLILTRVLDIPAREIAIELAPAAAGSLVSGLVAAGLASLLDSVGAPVTVTLFIASAAALVVYALLLRACFRPAWLDLAMVISRVLPRLPWRPSPRPAEARVAPMRSVGHDHPA